MTGMFIVVPSPDELLIHPCLGYAYTRLFGIDLKAGIILSLITYNGMGLVMVIGSLIIGGRVAVNELNNQINTHRVKLVTFINNSLGLVRTPAVHLGYDADSVDPITVLSYELD